MMNYKLKSKTTLSARERVELLNLLGARVAQYERPNVPVRTLPGHPFNGDPDGKSRFFWLYGDRPETNEEVNRFFMTIDRAIMASHDRGEFPSVANIVWWSLEQEEGSPKVLQVYVTHEHVQGNNKRGAFYFLGAFFSEYHEPTHARARGLAGAYAREWGQKVQTWGTTTPWVSVATLDLYAWTEQTKVVE